LSSGESRRARALVLLVLSFPALLSACSATSGGSPKPTSAGRPLPAVTGVSPYSGPPVGGTNVTITGTAFSGATKVSFGSVAAPSFHVVSDDELTAQSPAESASIQTISVTTATGTSLPAPPNDQFTFAAPTPVVTAVTPNTGPIAGNTLVTITGSGFIGTGKVAFGTIAAASFTVVSDTEITAVTPPQLPGLHPVYVTTAGGRNKAGALASDYHATAPVSATSSVTPGSGPTAGGTTVTITGTGFSGVTKVAFGTVAAASFTVVSNTEITAVTPPNLPGTHPVFVTTAGGRSAAGTYGDVFTFLPPVPSVTAVTPSSGPATGGTAVTIIGTGFTGAKKVAFGAVAAGSFTVVSDTEITTVTPAQKAGTRVVYVTTTLRNTNSAAGAADEFTYLP
jgi:IPT/TIG domain-containing protein